MDQRSLTSVGLLGNKFDDETATLLLKIKDEKPALLTLCGLKPDQTKANFRGWTLGPPDPKLLAPEIIRGSLTQVFHRSDFNLQSIAHLHRF